MAHVSIDTIHKSFSTNKILDGVSVEIKSGEFFFLVGPSGCGKTTLLRIIAGLEVPDSGRILFDTKDVTATAVQDRNIGFVFQNYCLWPHMTVAQNISFGLELRGLTPVEQKERLGEMLDFVHLSGYDKRYPHELSGGQQQRVALARALALKPKVLLLDEPLSNLDAKLKESIREDLQVLQRTLCITTIAVTHDREDARYLATGVGIMEHGQIVCTGSVGDVWDQ